MDNPIFDDDVASRPKPDSPARDADPGPPDIPGDEMARDARIWREYNKLAKVEDEERTRAWNRGLGGIGLFAGVFSGVTATFLTESYQLMQPDFTEYTYRTLIATATNATLPLDKDFVVPPSARVVNCLWIASLMFSLSAALIAVMGADWSAAYYDRDADPDSENLSARQRVERRQFRVNNVRRWSMPAIILTAPMLMQISMLLFGIGLALFFVPIDPITQYITSSLAGVIVTIWVITTLSPAFIPGSPFRSPLTPIWRRRLLSIYSLLQNRYRRLTAAEEQHFTPVLSHVDDPWMEPTYVPTIETLKSALRWLRPHQHLFPVLYDALGDLSLDPKLARSVYWRISDREAAAAIRAHSRGHHFRVVVNSSKFKQSPRDPAKAVIDEFWHPPLQFPPLTEEYILARVVRGFTLDDIVAEILDVLPEAGPSFPPVIPPPKGTPPAKPAQDPQELPPLHTTTLVRLLESEGRKISTAFHILYIWRAQLVAHPGPIVEAMSGLLDAALQQPRPTPTNPRPPQTALDRLHDYMQKVLHRVIDRLGDLSWRKTSKKRIDRLLNKIFRRHVPSGPYPLIDPVRMLCFIIDNHAKLELFEAKPSSNLRREVNPDSSVPSNFPEPRMAFELLAYLCRHYPKDRSVTQYACVARTLCLLHPLLQGYEWNWNDVKFVLKRMPAPSLPARRLLRKGSESSMVPDASVYGAADDAPSHNAPVTRDNVSSPSITPSFLSHHVARALVYLLAPEQKWYLRIPTAEEGTNEADILLANICIRIAKVFESAPVRLPVHLSVMVVLEELLSHGSLRPLIRARGNRLLDLLAVLTTFFANHYPPIEGRLFLLFISSPGADHSAPGRWRLEEALPQTVIGGLLIQRKLVTKVLSALVRLRTRYSAAMSNDDEYWLKLAEGVHDQSRVLMRKTHERHWPMLQKFYHAMGFYPTGIPPQMTSISTPVASSSVDVPSPTPSAFQ